MIVDWAVLAEQFLHALSMWWVIIPAIFLGLIVGAIPGFSAANTIIILLPLTLAVDVEIGLIFMVALYCSSRMGAGVPAILVNIPGTAGAAATPLDGYPMTRQGRQGTAGAGDFLCRLYRRAGMFTTDGRAARHAVARRKVGVRHLHSRRDDRGDDLRHLADCDHRRARHPARGLIAGFFGLMIGAISAPIVVYSRRRAAPSASSSSTTRHAA